MIVWGGGAFTEVFDTGGRYNPFTDTWTATSMVHAPNGRRDPAVVWTGGEMIVWGGYFSDGRKNRYFNTGGQYNPITNSWLATTATGAPDSRTGHTAVWNGSEMIVWGGLSDDGSSTQFFSTGGRYCAQAAPAITLDTKRRKVAEINTVRLNWSGANSTDIDLYRDSVLIVTTANDGSYTDSTGDTGRARYTYQVCEAGTQACSIEVTVSFAH